MSTEPFKIAATPGDSSGTTPTIMDQPQQATTVTIAIPAPPVPDRGERAKQSKRVQKLRAAKNDLKYEEHEAKHREPGYGSKGEEGTGPERDANWARVYALQGYVKDLELGRDVQKPDLESIRLRAHDNWWTEHNEAEKHARERHDVHKARRETTKRVRERRMPRGKKTKPEAQRDAEKYRKTGHRVRVLPTGDKTFGAFVDGKREDAKKESRGGRK